MGWTEISRLNSFGDHYTELLYQASDHRGNSNPTQVFETVIPLQAAELKGETGRAWSFYSLGAEDDLNLTLDPIVFLPGEHSGAEAGLQNESQSTDRGPQGTW